MIYEIHFGRLQDHIVIFRRLLDLSVENKKKIQKWASPEKANPLIEKKSIYRMLKQNIYYCKIQTMRL